ncbi:MAG: 3-isopropylmalate dehydratase large subunit [Deltaproteobacteria bacterium]|jgi:3-isopropylmalate/(R)-2-methylmalate dehydratase large subunit|nr:3-isopropylmalate dehydratase large subunit [Deltaproteobacteria bacterium]
MTSLLDRLWDSHLVYSQEGRPDILYIDRHLVHEVTSNQAFEGLRAAGRRLRRPDLTCGVIDHSIPTDDRTRPLKDKVAEAQLAALERNRKEFGFQVFFGDTDPRQGVIHVCMPEQGLVLPGHSVVCGDSHTATHGAMGALAFGIGTSEVEHVLATQTLPQRKPAAMAVTVAGKIPPAAGAKDLILRIINMVGVGGGAGHAIEYRGEAIRALSMESRLTLCNMAIECGARMGLVAPDDVTFAYLEGRPYAPKGEDFRRAVGRWRELRSDDGHEFDKETTLDVSRLAPRITWGTNPAQNVPATGHVPSLESFKTVGERRAAERALAYQKLEEGVRLEDVTVDYVFIGSCTNGRYEDLSEAARVFRSRKVRKGVTVLVVPGSGPVKRRAEKEGLDRIFRHAGCEWREPGCSMCLAMNPDAVPPGNRCVSTSNRNFEGRQGRLAMTHLASPATAAACAVAGRITNVRNLRRFI